MKRSPRSTAYALATGLVLAMLSISASAASVFEGVWTVKDTDGKPFEITLSADGSSKASRGEGMVGTWKDDGSAAVITWNTGWTTKILKDTTNTRKPHMAKGNSSMESPSILRMPKRRSEQ